MMNILDLTLPNLVGYLAVGWAAVCALSHVFAAHECRRRLAEAEAAFEQTIGPYLWVQEGEDRRETLRELLRERSGLHPSAGLLARSLAEPRLVRDDLAVQSWIVRAVHDHLGELRRRMERLRSTAPVIGMSGTISGFLIGTWTFGQTQDQAGLMTSVALALVTTLVAGLVVLLERWALEGTMKPLQHHLALHAQTVVAQARALWCEPESENERLRFDPARPVGEGTTAHAG